MLTTHIDVAGTRVAVHESTGRGVTTILVHGNSMSARAFSHQLDGALGDEFHLVAIDLPGHGESDRATDRASTYSIPGFASILTTVARILSIEDGVFVGGSLGGHIVLEAVPHLPAASGFCIFGTPPLTFPPNLDRAFLPSPAAGLLFKEDLSDEERHLWVSEMIGPGVELPSEFLDDLRRTDPTVRSSLLNSLGTIGFRDETDVAASLEQPLAVIHGDHDTLANADYIASLRLPSLWRGAVQRIPGGGHAVQWDSSPAFDALLAAFLRELAR